MGSYDEFVSRKGASLASEPVPHGEISDALFPHQRDLVRWALRRGRAAIFASTGLGKALDADTPVLTADRGFVRIGDIQVGDRVIGRDGKPIGVVGVFPQGKREGYRVSFSDGTSTVCDREHLWTVRARNDRQREDKWQTLTLGEILDRGVAWAQGGIEGRSSRWFIPMVAPVEFDEVDLPLDPYVLGCLIGDGSIITSPAFTSADPDIIAEINCRLPIGYECRKQRYAKYQYQISRPGGSTGVLGLTNIVTDALRELGLLGRDSYTKFVPDPYKFAASDTRLALVRGMMDTDGSVWNQDTSPVLEYSTASRQLALDFHFLIQSIGGRSKIKERTVGGRTHYRVHPNMPRGINPFLLPRKASRWKDREKYKPSRSIRNVEPVGEREMVCIAVDAPDGLFVVNDCIVTHNTRMEIEWAKHVAAHTGQPVLMLAPLAVARQMVDEGAAFGVGVTLCREAGDVGPGINVTNYQRLHKFDPSIFGGVVCDESSLIKNSDSKTLSILLDAFKHARFKLCGTATPAPNDYTELGTHAEFLGVCTKVEMLSEYFVHDGGETQTWRLKGHARAAFWKWVASWGAVVRHPRDLGYDTAGYDLPELIMHEHTIEGDIDQAWASGSLFVEPARTLNERRSARRGSLDARVEACAKWVNGVDERWIVWCDLNDEGAALRKAISGAVEVAGGDDIDTKEERLEAFSRGDTRVLVSKPKIAGWGCNWQHVRNVAFVGVTDSFEAYYQAIRRCWRFGQKRPVNVHVFASELEGNVVANLKRKEADAAHMAEQVAEATRDAVIAEVRGVEKLRNTYQPAVEMAVPAWLVSEAA